MRRELYINGRLADIDGVAIPLTFACSEIADLSGVSGNYSLTVKLPLTGPNILIAYFANLPNTSPAALWTGYKTTGSYFVDGVPIFQNADVRLLSSEKTIDVQITFGNLTWLEYLGNYKLKDYVNIDQIPDWNYWSVENETVEVRWVMADYGGTFMDGVHMERLYPCVQAVRIWNQIWSRLVIDGIIVNVPNNVLDYDIWIPLSNLTHNPAIPIGETFDLADQALLSDQIDPLRYTDGLSLFDCSENHPGLYFENVNGYFIVPITGTYRIRMHSSVYVVVEETGYSTLEVDFSLKNRLDDSIVQQLFEGSWIDGTDNESHPFSYDGYLSLKKGDVLYLSLYSRQSGVPGYKVLTYLTDVNDIFQIDYVPDLNKKTRLEFFMPVDIDYNLPDISCKDFVKAVMQLYGVLVENTDYSSGIEKYPVFFNLDYLKTGKIPNDTIYNWSEKLVSFDRPKIEWNLGLKERNYLRYTEDETDNIFEDAYFTTYETDNSEKDLFKSIFAASDDVSLIGTSYFPVPVCSIPQWVVDEKTDEWKYEGKCKQRIFRAYQTGTTFEREIVQLYTEEYAPILIDETFAYISYFKDVPDDVTWTNQGLDMASIITKYYQGFIDAVKSNRLFTFQFLLNQIDINKFTHITPVWIEKFSNYFFVKKILNWEAGRVCNVEMLQLYDSGEVAPAPTPAGLELTFDDIANVPVADASSVSDWNTFFDLPTNGSPFTSVEVVGDMVRLIGGSGITITTGIFENEDHLLKFDDKSGCVIEIEYQSFNSLALLEEVNINSVTNIGNYAFYDVPSLSIIRCWMADVINDNSFAGLSILSILEFHSYQYFGNSTGEDGVFGSLSGQTITLTIPAALMTCNGGNPDGDIQYLQANNTVTIVTV